MWIFAFAICGCGKNRVRLAEDITPGNIVEKELDWRYGANDIRIQTSKILKTLFDRWDNRTRYNVDIHQKPRVVISEVDNQTDQYISLEVVRQIVEGVAVNDGRFVVVVGASVDEKKLDSTTSKIANDPKYAKAKDKIQLGKATPPELLATISISKAITSQKKYDIEDYRMTITLYDLESQQIVDSMWDVLRKKVRL